MMWEGQLIGRLMRYTHIVLHIFNFFSQVTFSPDGRTLVTGARRDGRLLCWDVRQTGRVLRACERVADSNQRIMFSLDSGSRWLASGSQDGTALAFDLAADATAPPLVLTRSAHAVNAAMLHPLLPLLGVATGERERAFLAASGSDSDSGSEESVAEGEPVGADAPSARAPSAAATDHPHAIAVHKVGWVPLAVVAQ